MIESFLFISSASLRTRHEDPVDGRTSPPQLSTAAPMTCTDGGFPSPLTRTSTIDAGGADGKFLRLMS